MSTFRISGYAVNKRGLTVGINFNLLSASAREATAKAMNQAQHDSYTHVRINQVREVAA
ncbi:hypothetical protein [Rahnella inusitata]|uniref:hypothetical protein n=1 Tax=Rahnella inusitata TaxID=58169 RepID=UPI0039AF3158